MTVAEAANIYFTNSWSFGGLCNVDPVLICLILYCLKHFGNPSSGWFWWASSNRTDAGLSRATRTAMISSGDSSMLWEASWLPARPSDTGHHTESHRASGRHITGSSNYRLLLPCALHQAETSACWGHLCTLSSGQALLSTLCSYCSGAEFLSTLYFIPSEGMNFIYCLKSWLPHVWIDVLMVFWERLAQSVPLLYQDLFLLAKQ